MGHKAFREHYRIGHIVKVNERGVCIGSPYIPDLIVVAMDGTILEEYDRLNEDLKRYVAEMKADPAKLREVLNAPDTFEASIPVYTYKGADIIEKLCEKPGWPNVTHDGDIMYENTFSTDKAKVVAWAKRNAGLGVKFANDKIEQLKSDIARVESNLAKELADLAKLNADYPEVEAAK